MSYVGTIAILVLTPILWILSHKFFRFIYFGNIGQSVIKELLECFFISILLVSVFGAIMKSLLAFVGKVLLFVLKAALVLAAVVFVFWLIAKIIGKVKQIRSGDHEDTATPAENVVLPTADAPAENHDEPNTVHILSMAIW